MPPLWMAVSSAAMAPYFLTISLSNPSVSRSNASISAHISSRGSDQGYVTL